MNIPGILLYLMLIYTFNIFYIYKNVFVFGVDLIAHLRMLITKKYILVLVESHPQVLHDTK